MNSIELTGRFLQFATEIIKLTREINDPSAGATVKKQLLRSATSAGANYQEAISAQSKDDFIHKNHMALKELQETHYWLQLIGLAELLDGNDTMLKKALDENIQLIRIISKTIITARRNAFKNMKPKN